ncbi:DUF4190 domain-containing protein [Paenibacillus sp. BR2-3]|uniref:DUF4190 domain-containing protein n=1 Tax=Paenibacillus sp. BR2-3 TaxID=3048494 RepID=UPI003977841C
MLIGIIDIILASISLKEIKIRHEQERGLAIAGLVCGIVGTLICSKHVVLKAFHRINNTKRPPFEHAKAVSFLWLRVLYELNYAVTWPWLDKYEITAASASSKLFAEIEMRSASSYWPDV